MRDLTAATAYLETAGETIPWPSLEDLNNWAGLNNYNPALMDDLQIGVNNNQVELEKMAVLMRAVVKKLHEGVTVEGLALLDHEGVALPSPLQPLDPLEDVVSD